MVKHYLQRIKQFGIYSNTANDLWPLGGAPNTANEVKMLRS